MKEKIQFYYMAQGSLIELKNFLLIARDVNYISSSQFKQIAKDANVVHALLQGLIKKSKSFAIHKSIRTTLLPALFVFVSASFPQTAHAAAFDLSIEPPLSQITIKPGKSLIQAFTIRNNTDHSQPVVASLVPFTGDKQGFPVLDFDSLPPWLSIFSLVNKEIRLNQPFSIPAGGSDQIVLHIKIPEDTPPEDYYGVLLISEAGLGSVGTGTSLSGAVAANLLISVSGVETPPADLSVIEFLPHGHLFRLKDTYFSDSLSPLTFSAAARNRSPQLAALEGSLEINKSGRPLYSQLVKPGFILKFSDRQLQSSSSADSTFSFQPKLTDLGPLNAVLTLNQPGHQAQSRLHLFIFPFRLLLALIVVLVFLSTFLRITISQSTDTSTTP